MVKSIFQKGKEKAERRKKFLEEAKKRKMKVAGRGRKLGVKKKQEVKERKMKVTGKGRKLGVKKKHHCPKPTGTTGPSVFAKGRAKKARRDAFTQQAHKESIALLKEELKEAEEKGKRIGGTRPRVLKRAKEMSKLDLYKKAQHIKRKERRGLSEPISQFNKNQLQRFILKYE